MRFVVYYELGYGLDMDRRFICETDSHETATQIATLMANASQSGAKFLITSPEQWILLELWHKNAMREAPGE